MKNLLFNLLILTGLLALTGCSMKECKCFSSNQAVQNDSIVRITYDSVYNYTRENCEQFNKDEIIEVDSLTTIHHTLLCEEN